MVLKSFPILISIPVHKQPVSGICRNDGTNHDTGESNGPDTTPMSWPSYISVLASITWDRTITTAV